MAHRASLVVSAALLLASASGRTLAQASEFSLRFHGTGANQQDRVRIRIDDDASGSDASAPCDVGAGSFTIELWLRGKLADNPAVGHDSGDVESADESWRNGHVFLDRDIWGPSFREFGASLAGGRVRFGTGAGDSGDDLANTIEGSTLVLDGKWHQVALVRDASSGTKLIYVDGALDFASSPGASDAELSYPDGGVSGQSSPWGPFLVLGAEKHDMGAAFPSYSGFMDELRVWTVSRTAGEIAATWNVEVPPDASGLVADWRFERGTGTQVFDSSIAGSPTGELIAGVFGNGEWKARASAPNHAAPIESTALPAGFSAALVATGFVEPTLIEALPDGRLFVGERAGRILVLKNGALLPTPLITIATDTQNGERGLVGLALDPQFSANGWIYAHYTTTEPRNRVARFTVSSDLADPASEFVVWENPDLASDWHHGGAIGFLADGTLLIATGDQLVAGNAQLRGNQHGKLLRVNADGSIPADNPFVNDPSFDPAIFALGLRNPFRAFFDGVTGLAWIGNVGGNSTTSWEEIEIARAGANFGWPNQEGPECYVADCSPYDFPAHSYQHDDPRYFGDAPQASLTLGPIVRGTAYPEDYREQLYFGDYANRWLRRLVLDASGEVVADAAFLAPPAAGTIVDSAVDPDGALWFLDIGIAWSGSSDTPAVWRIDWIGSGNLAPVAVASAAPMTGQPPLNVQFTGSGSFDPNGGPGPLAYSWDLGDGNVATTADPTHVYPQRGVYDAVLTVDDGASISSSAPLSIQVGTPPVPVIAKPSPGLRYRAGERIQFAGYASDAEDGPLPDAALSWRVLLVHAGHVHPFLGPIDGQPGGHFKIPRHGHSPERTHFEIALTATDADGLATEAIVALDPIAVPIEFDTVPSGIPIFLDGEALPTPRRYQSVAGYVHQLEAPIAFELGGITYAWAGFSDGGPRRRPFETPDPDSLGNGVRLVAEYVPTTLQTADVPVASADHNAEWYLPHFEELVDFYYPDALCFGRDSVSEIQAGVMFALPIPPGSLLLSATLVLTGAGTSVGSPLVEIRAYDAPDPVTFKPGHKHLLTMHAPIGDETVHWSPEDFVVDQEHESPDLSALLQPLLDGPDWTSGQRVGLVLDGSPTPGSEWRCFHTQQSGAPARLVVTWIERPNDPKRR